MAHRDDHGPPARPPEATAGIKQVPAARSIREAVRAQAAAAAGALERGRPLSRSLIETRARRILVELRASEDYLGWTMVALASAYWREQIVSIPPERRLLLLPHCLRCSAHCPAEYSEVDLRCRECGACALGELRARAAARGYRVLIAEGTPVVMQLILSGQADALLGVSCLNVLEKSLAKILSAGLPCMAIPLHEATCRDTTSDEDWITEMIDLPYRPATSSAPSYVHLLRAARRLFDRRPLLELLPPSRSWGDAETPAADPVAATEWIAYDFLLAGGKRSRPFITLAAYDAARGGPATGPDGAARAAEIPASVASLAVAIELFHKASLVHDDIEDADDYRYGRPTLHRRFDTATAINAGDYLLGLGYRVVARQRADLGDAATAEILSRFAEAHTRLCEGQGAELAWRSAPEKAIRPLEALKLYTLKTAPAFEAALLAGLRAAAPLDGIAEAVGRFARHLGVAFQIVNDLEDWQVDQPNKCHMGSDLLGGRPTLLWALALEGLDETGRRELMGLVPATGQTAAAPGMEAKDDAIARAAALYQKADVFRQARELIGKHHRRAAELAERVDPPALRHLLVHLADTILDLGSLSSPAAATA